MPLSCAAPIDWNAICLILTVKNAPILGPRSGVSYSGVLGAPVRSWHSTCHHQPRTSSVARLGLDVQRGGRKAGEPASGVCARCGAPSGCRTVCRAGSTGAFHVGALRSCLSRFDCFGAPRGTCPPDCVTCAEAAERPGIWLPREACAAMMELAERRGMRDDVHLTHFWRVVQTGRPTACASAAASAPPPTSKKARISRAQRSAACAG